MPGKDSFPTNEHGALDLTTSQPEPKDGLIRNRLVSPNDFTSTLSDLSRSLNIPNCSSSSKVVGKTNSTTLVECSYDYSKNSLLALETLNTSLDFNSLNIPNCRSSSKVLGKRNSTTLNEYSHEFNNNSLLALKTLNDSLDPFTYNVSKRSGKVNTNAGLRECSSTSLNKFSIYPTVKHKDLGRKLDKICNKSKSSLVNDGASTSATSKNNTSTNKPTEKDKTICQHNQFGISTGDELNSTDFRRVTSALPAEKLSLSPIPSSSRIIKSGEIWFPPEGIPRGYFLNSYY